MKYLLLIPLLLVGCGDGMVVEDIPADSAAVPEVDTAVVPLPPEPQDSIGPIPEPPLECPEMDCAVVVESDPMACWPHPTLGWMCPVPAGAPWNSEPN